MIVYSNTELDVDSKETFKAIPISEFDKEMEKLDYVLSKKMAENQRLENKSIREAIALGDFFEGGKAFQKSILPKL